MTDNDRNIAKCHRENENCLMYHKGKCVALTSGVFNEIIDGVVHSRQCPFYKVSKNKFKYAVWDKVKEEVVDFAENIEYAQNIVRVASNNYYQDGLHDTRFIIKDWKGELWKLHN